MIDFINKIYNENCLDTMKRIPNEFIDTIITSPPYDKLRDYKTYSFDFEPIAIELYRILKDNGVLCWIVGDSTIKGNKSLTSFKQALFFQSIGFSFNDNIIYEKNTNGFNNKHQKRHLQSYEYIFILSKGTIKTFNPILDRENNLNINKKGKIVYNRKSDGSTKKNILTKDRNQFGIRKNIWRYNVGYMSSTKDKCAYKHPAIMPELLAQDLIITYSNENDLIYDPFMGSGTVAKQCKLNNRNYIGSEISKDYCDIIETRLKKEETLW